MTTRRRKRHTPEQIVRKLRDAEAMLNSGKDEAAVLQTLEISSSTFERWRLHSVVLLTPAVIRLIGDLQQPADLWNFLPFAKLHVGTTQLRDDLVHRVSVLLHL